GLLQQRFGQPGADIGLAPHARRFQLVEAQPRHRLRQEGARILHLAVVGPVPAQIGLLHRIFGLRERTQHAVGKAGEMPPMRLELLGAGPVRRHHAACRSTGTGAPPTLTGMQARPWRRAYFIVGYMRPAVIAKASETTAREPQRSRISARRLSAPSSCASTACAKRNASATSG